MSSEDPDHVYIQIPLSLSLQPPPLTPDEQRQEEVCKRGIVVFTLIVYLSILGGVLYGVVWLWDR